jgi:hypothetical protein
MSHPQYLQSLISLSYPMNTKKLYLYFLLYYTLTDMTIIQIISVRLIHLILWNTKHIPQLIKLPSLEMFIRSSEYGGLSRGSSFNTRLQLPFRIAYNASQFSGVNGLRLRILLSSFMQLIIPKVD